MEMADINGRAVSSVEEARTAGPYLSLAAQATIEAAFRHGGLTCSVASGGYLVTITRDGDTDMPPIRLVGSDLPLNGIVPMGICKDKVLASLVMSDGGVPCVPHVLAGDVGEDSIIHVVEQSADGRIVAKPTCGMQGRGVTLLRGRTAGDMLREIRDLSAAEGYDMRYGICLSPYRPGIECRVIGLDGEPLLSYAKGRKHGDNTTEWRHNLCLGSVPVPIPAVVDIPSLHALVRFAADTIGIRFASVDVIVDDSGDMQVLEVNGTPAITKWAQCVPDGWERSVELYGRALDACLRDATSAA